MGLLATTVLHVLLAVITVIPLCLLVIHAQLAIIWIVVLSVMHAQPTVLNARLLSPVPDAFLGMTLQLTHSVMKSANSNGGNGF